MHLINTSSFTAHKERRQIGNIEFPHKIGQIVEKYGTVVKSSVYNAEGEDPV